MTTMYAVVLTVLGVLGLVACVLVYFNKKKSGGGSVSYNGGQRNVNGGGGSLSTRFKVIWGICLGLSILILLIGGGGFAQLANDAARAQGSQQEESTTAPPTTVAPTATPTPEPVSYIPGTTVTQEEYDRAKADLMSLYSAKTGEEIEAAMSFNNDGSLIVDHEALKATTTESPATEIPTTEPAASVEPTATPNPDIITGLDAALNENVLRDILRGYGLDPDSMKGAGFDADGNVVVSIQTIDARTAAANDSLLYAEINGGEKVAPFNGLISLTANSNVKLTIAAGHYASVKDGVDWALAQEGPNYTYDEEMDFEVVKKGIEAMGLDSAGITGYGPQHNKHYVEIWVTEEITVNSADGVSAIVWYPDRNTEHLRENERPGEISKRYPDKDGNITAGDSKERLLSMWLFPQTYSQWVEKYGTTINKGEQSNTNGEQPTTSVAPEEGDQAGLESGDVKFSTEKALEFAREKLGEELPKDAIISAGGDGENFCVQFEAKKVVRIFYSKAIDGLNWNTGSGMKNSFNLLNTPRGGEKLEFLLVGDNSKTPRLADIWLKWDEYVSWASITAN